MIRGVQMNLFKRLTTALLIIALIGLTACNGLEKTIQTKSPFMNHMSNSGQQGLVNTDGEWHYFSNIDSNEAKFYKCRPDGSELRILLNEPVSFISVYGEWLVFVKANDSKPGIFKMKKDGSDFTKLTDISAFAPMLYKDKLYFSNFDDNQKLYTFDLITNTAEQLGDVITEHTYIFDDWVYYQNWNDSYKVYRIKCDGSVNELIIDHSVQDIFIDENGIMFTYDGFWRYNPVEKSTELVMRMDQKLYSLCISQFGFYYLDISDETPVLMKNDYSVSEVVKISNALNVNSSGIFQVEDWLYYRDYNRSENKSEFCRIKTDGTQFEVIDLSLATSLVK